MRAFIGIEFDEQLKKQIGSLQRKFREMGLAGRWKHIDNFHLTLKFLDEISTGEKAGIHSSLKEMRMPPFKLTMSGIGCFNGRGSIRVLYLKLGGDVERLLQLQADVENRMEQLGFARENRPYTPHVTIGQDIVSTAGIAELEEVFRAQQFNQQPVDCIKLIKSEQIGQRRMYTPVGEYCLTGQ